MDVGAEAGNTEYLGLNTYTWLLIFSQVLCAVVTYLIIRAYRTKHIPRPSVEDEQLEDKTVHPFTIKVADEVLRDLQTRLEATRFPPNSIADDNETDYKKKWTYGTSQEFARQLLDYWKNRFDWRKQEAMLNRFSHFMTNIDGRQVHFIHERSSDPKAVPLLLLHGWPGSFFEFYKIIEPLVNPKDGSQAFHVVCPSLPGYGFSSPPTKPGHDVQKMAADVAKLMRRLGYQKYYAQGGDWGALISSYIPLVDPERCAGIHINMVAVGPPPGIINTIILLITLFPLRMFFYSKADLAGLAATQHYLKEESGYAHIQGSKPQTLGYGLGDSPVGLMTWIVEKFHTWSDCNGDIESKFTKDELLTNVMIYWVSNCITSSMRLYYETKKSGRWGPVDQYVPVPTGCAIFKREIIKCPRRWAKYYFNIQRWTTFATGGHFAALEEPNALLGDIRAFFGSLQ